jgi:hypothetical protein
MLGSKCLVSLILTGLQCWYPLLCNASRRESKGCSYVLIGFIILVSAIIYCLQRHLAALIFLTSVLAYACGLLNQILTPVYEMCIFSLTRIFLCYVT